MKRSAIFCGAGISVEGPSSLPTGGDLALLAFDLATGRRAYPFPAEAVARLRRQIGEGSLRLEVICDLLSMQIPSATVVSVFSLLEDSLPNRLHLAIALLAPAAVITTNQDRLLEDAALLLGRPLWPMHLHGRFDSPGSIITTVTDYVHGLSDRKRRVVTRLVEDRDLVVVGYSGRDLDVMSALVEMEPRRILWVEHEGQKQPVQAPPELEALARHFSDRFIRLREPTGEWLVGHLEPGRQQALEQMGFELERDDSWRKKRERRLALISARYADVDESSRALAIGGVLRHAGMQGDARAGFEHLRSVPPSDHRLELAWAETIFELNDFESAILAFRDFRLNGAEPRLRSQAILGEVEALRNLSRFDEAREVLRGLDPVAEEITDAARRSEVLAAGRCQLGGLARMDGDLTVAESAYQEAEVRSLVAGDVRDALESRSWRAEILLARGRYREALAESVRTLAYAPLANKRWLTWARFVHCEALFAECQSRLGLKTCRETLEAFAGYGNPMGEAWALMVEASFIRSDDPVRAGHALDAAREAIGRYRGPMSYAESRLLWEEAELHRATGDLEAAEEGLRSYRRHVDRRFPRGHAWLDAHGEGLDAELARGRGEKRAPELARCARASYEALGAEGAARRMLVAESSDGDGPGFRLAAAWEEEGFALELQALRIAESRGYVPLNIWFVP